MADDETQLVKRAAEGDADAFAELVRRYRDAVYGYCYHRTASFEDARDLAQDAFVRAYTHLDQLREAEKFGGWVCTIAANLCVHWAESRREIAVESVEKGEEVQEFLHAAVVREALSSLPGNERLAAARALESMGVDTERGGIASFLAVGNWWKWRWVEGEEELGFRTEFYGPPIVPSNVADQRAQGDLWECSQVIWWGK